MQAHKPMQGCSMQACASMCSPMTGLQGSSTDQSVQRTVAVYTDVHTPKVRLVEVAKVGHGFVPLGPVTPLHTV